MTASVIGSALNLVDGNIPRHRSNSWIEVLFIIVGELYLTELSGSSEFSYDDAKILMQIFLEGSVFTIGSKLRIN